MNFIFSHKSHYITRKNLLFCRRDVDSPKYVSIKIISSMTFAGDTSKIANFDLWINVNFVTPFFWMKKFVISLTSTGKILFITFIPRYSTYRIHKSSYLFRENLEFHVLQYICISAVEKMRIDKGFVTTKLIFLLDYWTQAHTSLKFREKKSWSPKV